MPGSFNKPPHLNTPSESDSVESDSLDNTKPGQADNSFSDLPEAMPLPTFGQNEAEEESAVQTSTAAGPDTAENMTTQKPEQSLGAKTTTRQPTYKISPAEPNWSEYVGSPAEDSAAEAETQSGWKTAWAVLREVGETIILTLIIFFLIQTVIRNFRVVGTSMVDNLHDGQYLIINKLGYNKVFTKVLGIGGPQRGDVVVFEPPNRPGEDYVKRIIGLPGETVEVRQGKVYINGEPLAEPFQPTPGSYSTPPITVPEGQVFVLGDNRNNSNDSHNWGPLPVENIVGRAWLSYWPPDQWGVIPRDEPTKEATLKRFLGELVPGASADTDRR